MCEIMQKLQDEGRAEGRAEERYSTAKRMLLFNEPIEKIVAYTSLSEDCIYINVNNKVYLRFHTDTI